MLYKEWRTVRLRAGLATVAYLLLAVWVLYNPGLNGLTNEPYPLFYSWVRSSSLLTVGLALLLGVDMVSRERSEGTLDFLLSRPIARWRIYATKLALRAVCLLLPYGLVSGWLFDTYLDQVPAPHYSWLADSGVPVAMGDYNAFALDPNVGILAAAFGGLAGLAVLCLSGLISVYTRNVVQTLAFSVVALLGFMFANAFLPIFLLNADMRTGYVEGMGLLYWANRTNVFIHPTYNYVLRSLEIGGLAVALGVGGLLSFARYASRNFLRV